MSDEVCQEGLQYILETAFTEEQSVPASFYLGLCEDASIAEDASLADLTELAAADGYARNTIASDGTDWASATTGTNDWKITSLTQTFTASGTWNGATHTFLGTTTDDSGKLVLAAALSVERFLVSGDTLQVSIVLTATG